MNKSNSVAISILYCPISLFLQQPAALFWNSSLPSKFISIYLSVSNCAGEKIVLAKVKVSVLETLLLPIVRMWSVGLIETWSSREKLCLGLGGQAFVVAWGVFFWAASVDFPVIIMQSHRIEEINEYVGGEEVADGYLPFCKKIRRVCARVRGRYLLLWNMHYKMCNKQY